MNNHTESHWVFDNGNTYCRYLHSYEKALELSKTIVDCVNCTNCSYSTNCKDCADCNENTDCHDNSYCCNCVSCSLLWGNHDKTNKKSEGIITEYNQTAAWLKYKINDLTL